MKKKFSSEKYINKGYVSIEENVIFRTQVEALNALGSKEMDG